MHLPGAPATVTSWDEQPSGWRGSIPAHTDATLISGRQLQMMPGAQVRISSPLKRVVAGSNPVAGLGRRSSTAEHLRTPDRLDLGHHLWTRLPPHRTRPLSMSKFNTKATDAATGASPVRSESTATGRTFEGAPGYARDAKSELFLLAVTNMVGEHTFYEKAGDRDSRFAALVHQVAAGNPDWTAQFLAWLRSEAN